jgi:ribonuclease P/MRP protein subunit POP5
LLKRVKRRYLALQIDSEGALSRKEFIDAVWGAIIKLYGEYGASQTNLALIDYDLEKKTAVIRTSLVTLDLVRASLASITCLVDRTAAVHVLAVSGTIKALCKTLKR